MNDSGLQHMVYERTVCAETVSATQNLTFVYISFPNLFCQNKIKKNRKYAPQIFPKDTEMRRE